MIVEDLRTWLNYLIRLPNPVCGGVDGRMRSLSRAVGVPRSSNVAFRSPTARNLPAVVSNKNNLKRNRISFSEDSEED